MSEGNDTFWANLAEKFLGLILIIIGAVMVYYTATSMSSLGSFSAFFGVLSAILIIIGVFLLVIRAPK